MLKQYCQIYFPNNQLIENTPFLQHYIHQLKEYFDQYRKKFTFPLHVMGTDFQKDVWNALLTIPYGETVSYSKIASMIKKPMAVRAVGTAIGKNPISIVIACHRVIGKNGALTGYSGGIDIKTKLLQLEGVSNIKY